MTALLGHLMNVDFGPAFKKWTAETLDALFTAPIIKTVNPKLKALEDNLKAQARMADLLVIWTDCDREGENIGAEVAQVCRAINPRIIVKRGIFLL